MKIWAVCDGGDWYDASVFHVILPKDVEMKEANDRWHEWYTNKYIPAYRTGERPHFISFERWLIEREGGQKPSEDQLEEYWVP